MAYLNRQEREALLRDLTTMNFNKAKGKLRRMDPNVKLAFLRNAQASGEFHTRYILPGAGVIATLIETETEQQTATNKPGAAPIRTKADFQMRQVIVEPTPENHT
jgi:hypothetical protein